MNVKFYHAEQRKFFSSSIPQNATLDSLVSVAQQEFQDITKESIIFCSKGIQLSESFSLKKNDTILILPKVQSISTDLVQQLVKMGYPRTRSVKSLRFASTLSGALDWLHEHWEDDDIDS